MQVKAKHLESALVEAGAGKTTAEDAAAETGSLYVFLQRLDARQSMTLSIMLAGFSLMAAGMLAGFGLVINLLFRLMAGQ